MEIESPADPQLLPKALKYLQQEARDAHLAGDGMRVLHLCTVALTSVASEHFTDAKRTYRFDDVRWAIYLGLYWLLDEWFIYVVEKAVPALPWDEESKHDRIFITWLLELLKHPVPYQSPALGLTLPDSWIRLRSSELEDQAALSFAIELCWYLTSDGDSWSVLAERWLTVIEIEQPLFEKCDRLIARLRAQGRFCRGTYGLPDDGQANVTGSRDQQWLLKAWRLFFDCQFEELEGFLTEIAPLIRVESLAYSPFFRIFHISRFHRQSHEDQSVSLSRLNFVISRQPADVFRQLRDARFEEAFATMARRGFPEQAANERFVCLRMAMLNQIHALRSWDVGGWIAGEEQRGQAALELGARGDLRFARLGILALVRAQSIGDPKKYPHLARCFKLLDALSVEDRSRLVTELTSTRRIEWPSANVALAELSDSIPDNVLLDVARWSAKLELDNVHNRFSWTHLQFWGAILSVMDECEDVIEILKPALIMKASHPGCWMDLHALFIAAIRKGREVTAKEILIAILGAPTEGAPFPEYLASIVLNLLTARASIRHLCFEWLSRYVEKSGDAFYRHHVKRYDGTGARNDAPIDDAEFRQWIVDEFLSFCDAKLAEKEQVNVGGFTFHGMINNVIWPTSQEILVNRLVEVVDAEWVPYANKFEPLASLGALACAGATEDQIRISEVALRWLQDGIKGRDLTFGGPLSIGHTSGLGESGMRTALLFLLSSVAKRHSTDAIEKRIAEWLLLHGTRQPLEIINQVIMAALHLSIHLSAEDPLMSMALVGTAEAASCISSGMFPAKVVFAFCDVMFSHDVISGKNEWEATSAGRMCEELWVKRLNDISHLADAEARRAVAITISRWEKSGKRLPEVLLSVRSSLAADCRRRVRINLSAGT